MIAHPWLKASWQALQNTGVSVSGVLLAGWLCTPFAQRAAGHFEALDTVFLAAGGMIGAIMALVFSLSMIPIQRATEIFGPPTASLYSGDRATQRMLLFMALACLVSFVLAVEGVVGLPRRALLPVEIILVAVTLDLVRWHFRRVARLIQPAEGIRRLLEEILTYVEDAYPAPQAGRRLPEGVTPEDKAALATYHNRLTRLTADLAESAMRAVERGDTYTAQAAAEGLARVACQYLAHRRDTLVLYPSRHAGFLASESDADALLIPIYDSLSDIHRAAVGRSAEITCIHLVRAFEAIARCTSSLKARCFRPNSAPLSHMPLGYLEQCVARAQRAGLDDVALQASHSLRVIATSAPAKTRCEHLHLPAIECAVTIARRFLEQAQAALANKVVEDVMLILHHTLAQDHPQSIQLFAEALQQMENLVPLGVAHERRYRPSASGSPLCAAYGIAYPTSLAVLVARLSARICSAGEQHPPRPRHLVLDVSEEIYRHLRRLGERVDFGSSFMLWEISHTIKEILRVFVSLLDSVSATQLPLREELVRQALWFLSFFCAAFSRGKTIEHVRAEDACDILAWAALSLYTLGDGRWVAPSAADIASVTASYCSVSERFGPYKVADLMMPIWYMRLAAQSRCDAALVAKLDKRMEKPAALSAQQWGVVQDALDTRKEQLEGELMDIDDIGLMDDAGDALKRLLLSDAADRSGE